MRILPSATAFWNADPRPGIEHGTQQACAAINSIIENNRPNRKNGRFAAI
jgi:hypothetical protein